MKELIKNDVEESIEELGRRFLQNPLIFFNEEDVRCHLFSIMLTFSKMSEKVYDLSEKQTTIRLHAQIECEDNTKPDILVIGEKTINLYIQNGRYLYEEADNNDSANQDIPIEIKFFPKPRLVQESDAIKKELKRLNDFEQGGYMLMVVICGGLTQKDLDSIEFKNNTIYYFNANHEHTEGNKPILLKKVGNKPTIKLN